MDDGDRDADAYKLLPGDEVNVIGKVDDDLFQTTTIDASRFPSHSASLRCSARARASAARGRLRPASSR